MATSSSTTPLHLRSLKVSVTVTFIFTLILLSPKSVLGVGLVFRRTGEEEESPGFVMKYERRILEQKKMVLGSRPPGCVNKCLNCRPCLATLVIPIHQIKSLKKTSYGGEDDNYYLLSWKCRCGNRLYQP